MKKGSVSKSVRLFYAWSWHSIEIEDLNKCCGITKLQLKGVFEVNRSLFPGGRIPDPSLLLCQVLRGDKEKSRYKRIKEKAKTMKNSKRERERITLIKRRGVEGKPWVILFSEEELKHIHRECLLLNVVWLGPKRCHGQGLLKRYLLRRFE